LSQSVVLSGGFAEPIQRFSVILIELLGCVTHAQIVFGIGTNLCRRFTIQLYRFDRIPFHALTKIIAETKAVLSRGVILFGRFAKPLRSLNKISCHALARGIARAQVALSHGVILLGGFSKPSVLPTSWATPWPGVTRTQAALSVDVILYGGLAPPLHRLCRIFRHTLAPA
jgi:hypothetical protein